MHLILALVLALSAHGVSAAESLDDQISRLLSAIKTSNCEFIRNDKSYTPDESIEHINKKYQHFKADISSMSDFINLSASKSLISGKPYYVRCGGGDPELSSEWLSMEARQLGINL
jgi:hypothetical protein